MIEIRTQRLLVGGIRVDALGREQLIETLDEAILSQQKLLVLNHNLHSLYLYEKTQTSQRLIAAPRLCISMACPSFGFAD